MISLIICSRSGNINSQLEDNLGETVGCDYELILIDNSENKYSIFQAYNLGIQRSTGEIICFVHDDIHMHTKNWGTILKNIFIENPKSGLIGISWRESQDENAFSLVGC